jgi:hypothetical protein
VKRLIPRAARLLKGAVAYGRGFPEQAYIDLRASHMLAEYRRRRDHYATEAARRNLAYHDALVAERTAARLGGTHIRVRPRPRGQPVHTLTFLPRVSWHEQLLAPLRKLGPLSRFDYNQHGLRSADLYARKPFAVAQRASACAQFERFAIDAARETPVDWVFVYAVGLEILPRTLERVREITGAPVVGMCFDDKQSWEDGPFGGEPAGQISLAPFLDLAWTCARVACDWYSVENGNPVFMGEGCSPELCLPGDPSLQDLDVCFVGARYGFRSWFVGQLEKAGVQVQTAGQGWPSGSISEAAMIATMQRAKIILGLGGIGWSPNLKNVKGRDFDAPCIGAYVTSFNPDLAEMFRIGEEIACYSTPDEAIEVVRALLKDPEARRSLAARGRARCLAEHTWGHRFERVLELLGIFE